MLSVLCLFLPFGVMYVTGMLNHQFICFFTVLLLLAFGVLFCLHLVVGYLPAFTCPNNFFNALASLFVSHPFDGTKKMIWLTFIHAFFLGLMGSKEYKTL